MVICPLSNMLVLETTRAPKIFPKKNVKNNRIHTANYKCFKTPVFRRFSIGVFHVFSTCFHGFPTFLSMVFPTFSPYVFPTNLPSTARHEAQIDQAIGGPPADGFGAPGLSQTPDRILWSSLELW